jgi:hypothetical protein
MYSRTEKSSSSRRLAHRALGLAALIGVLPAVALAAAPQGQWRGLVQQASTDVAVVVRFDAQAASIHFDEPFACDVPARFLKEDATATVYRFGVSQNGGRFCDSLLGGTVTIAPGSDDHLTIAFDAARNTWRGQLSLSAAAAPQP